jgi:hypothetical protein
MADEGFKRKLTAILSDEPEWNTFLAIHALKNKGLL